MAIVYKHIGEDNDEIFYIGIGKTEHRSISYNKRNKFWKNYVKKHGFKAEIIEQNLSWKEAETKEVELILRYGRRDLGTGTLVNLTNGGSGGDTMSGRKNPSLTKMNLESKGKPGNKLKWFNKDGKNKRVKEDKILEIEKLLKDGWKSGSVSHETPWMKNRKPWNYNVTGYKVNRKNRNSKYEKRSLVSCPYCEKIGDISNMKRWHFDNCKNKINETN